MLISTHKLVLATVILAGGLLSLASVASADSASSKFDAVGLADAVPLQDMQMDELRGTGLFGSAFLAFLNSLPPGNTVKAQLNDQTGFRTSTTMPVILSCGNGITCPAGMTVNLSANNNAPSGSVSVHLTITH